MITDINTKLNWRITDKLEFQQSFYAEVFGTVNPAFTTPMRPIATLQHSEGSAVLNGDYGSQLTWTISPKTLFTGRYNITQGGSTGSGSSGISRRLNTATRVARTLEREFTATRFRPRRDEVSGKINTYISGPASATTCFTAFRFPATRTTVVDIQPGGVIYSDLSGQPDQAQFVGPDVRGADQQGTGRLGRKRNEYRPIHVEIRGPVRQDGGEQPGRPEVRCDNSTKSARSRASARWSRGKRSRPASAA